MITFSPPRVSSDIATIVLGWHSDSEIGPAVIEYLVRRARIHIHLIVGNQAQEQLKDSILTDTLVYAVRRNRANGLPDPICDSADAFLKELRRLIILMCRQLGFVQRRDG